MSITQLQTLVLLVAVRTTAARMTCEADTGDHSLCACKMSDGSSIVDLLSYGKKDNSCRLVKNVCVLNRSVEPNFTSHQLRL